MKNTTEKFEAPERNWKHLRKTRNTGKKPETLKKKQKKTREKQRALERN